MSDQEPDLHPVELETPEDETDATRAPLSPLPSIDDEEPPRGVDYRDWSPETTKVVSGPIGPLKQYPGQRFRSRHEARRFWIQKAGRIIEDLSIAGRWIFRVRKDA